jgi:hypothetical protein
LHGFTPTVYALHTESQEDAPPELLLASRPNKAKEIQMHVKFSFDSHDSPEVLRLAGAFLTTLSDLDHQPQSQLSPSAEGERILFRRPSPFADIFRELPPAAPEGPDYSVASDTAPTAQEETPVAQEETPAKKKRAAKTVEEKSPAPQTESAQTAGGNTTTTPQPSDAVDLTTVRALLAEKSRAGKRTEVQALIAEYGVSALTDIPADKLGEVYSKGIAL